MRIPPFGGILLCAVCLTVPGCQSTVVDSHDPRSGPRGGATTQYELARALETRGDYAGARAALQRSLKLNDDFAPAWRLLGYLLLNESQWEKSATATRRALEIEPRDAAAQVNLGYALYRLGRSDRAYLHYQKALAISPTHRQALLYSGILLTDIRRIDEARRRFATAVRHHPEDAEAHFRLGALLATEYLPRSADNVAARQPGFADENEAQIYREARAHLERSLQLHPGLAHTHRLLVYLYLRAAEYSLAIRSARKVLSSDARDDGTRYNLALAYYYTGAYLKARSEFAHILERYPMTEQANVLFGNTCLRTGDPDRAFEAYRRALQINANNATAHANLAEIYAQRGQAKLAREHRAAACENGLPSACP